MTDWAIHVHVPTISFHLGTKERGGKVKKKKKNGDDGGRPIVYLYGTSFSGETEQEEKKGFISSSTVEMTDLLSQ